MTFKKKSIIINLVNSIKVLGVTKSLLKKLNLGHLFSTLFYLHITVNFYILAMFSESIKQENLIKISFLWGFVFILFLILKTNFQNKSKGVIL